MHGRHIARPVCTALAAALLALPDVSGTAAAQYPSQEHAFAVREVIGGLARPWSIAFLPDGALLVTERPGRLRLWRAGELHTVAGVPAVVASGQGGLLDVVLHPEHAANGLLYLTHSASYDGGLGTAITRARLDAAALELRDSVTIYRMPQPPLGSVHFGGRMAFDGAGFLYLGIGDRGQREHAQRLDRANGKVLRLHDGGAIPADNPFVATPGALPEVFTYGHRNPQGLYHDPETGWLWEHEHGPQGGDSLNILQGGANYGWPVATYGVEYGSAQPIGDLPHEREDIANPVTWWGPTSIAPSGLTRYRGDPFPRWHGNLFLGTLGQRHIRRLVIADATVLDEEVMLWWSHGRIRDVRAGPDGHIYFCTDENPGGVYRIEPLTAASYWQDLPGPAGWRYTGSAGQTGLGWVRDAAWPWVYIPDPQGG